MTLQEAINFLESIKDVQTSTVEEALTLVIKDYKKTHRVVNTKCLYCGEPFSTIEKRGGKKYCSKACAYNAWYMNLRKDPVKYRKRLDSQAKNARKRRQGIDK